MAMSDRTRRIKERELLETVQLASARYQDLSRKHSQALEEAYATESRDGSLLLERCLQMQSTVEEALDEYAIALKRFSELLLNRELPEELSINSEQQQAPARIRAENQRLLNRYRDATAVLAAASKQAVDGSRHSIPGGVDRLWPQCERAWLACVALADEIARKQHKTRGRSS
jgi:hypothetical protein